MDEHFNLAAGSFPAANPSFRAKTLSPVSLGTQRRDLHERLRFIQRFFGGYC